MKKKRVQCVFSHISMLIEQNTHRKKMENKISCTDLIIVNLIAIAIIGTL